MKYRLNDAKVFSDVTDGIAILIDMESGMYYGMNLFTTNVYESIVNGADTEELLSALASVKGYTEEIKTKFFAFLQELESNDFITEDADASAEVHLGFDEYPDDELDFVLSAYPDAADLLLADPIHQVKEELGWQPGREALK